jgi:putative N6-adenine-specific DNA methylase
VKLIAKTLEGLEGVLADEIAQLGGENIEQVNRAVIFTGDKKLLYKANLKLRTAIKILVFMQEFIIQNENDLYEAVKKIKWEELIGLDDTFAVDAVLNSPVFRHTNFIALKTKDAIVDRFRDKYGSRPNVDPKDPDLKINIHIRDQIATISLDSSGSSLHMRGYRRQQVDAPLNEVLAAGLVLLSGWDKKSDLIDPMCGSGTILCEAAGIAANKPSQSTERNFGFKKWKSFDLPVWEMVCDEVKEETSTTEMPVLKGFDISNKAVTISKANIINAGFEHCISIEQEDYFYQDDMENTLLIFNPPYDERLKEEDVNDFYKNIGDKLKSAFTNSTAWILSGHLEAMKNLGLRPSARKKLLNGSIPSVFCKFEIYKGSKKQKYNQAPHENHL